MNTGRNGLGHTVLFLGAGFAAGLELPVMRRFGAASREAQLNLARHAAEPEDSPNYRYAAPLLLEARRTYQAFQAYCKASGMPEEDDWDNLESVFSVAEALQQASSGPIALEGQIYRVQTIVEHIQTWIWKTYQQLPSESLRRQDQRHIDTVPYGALAELVAARYEQHDVSVITTNYDVVYEYFLNKAGLRALYPFGWIGGFGVGNEANMWVEPSTPGQFAGCVCKLHGSINYFENIDATGRDVGRVYVAGDYGSSASIGKSNLDGTFAREPAILAMDAIWAIRQKYGKGFVPAIIPPTYSKLRERQWLRQTWSKALKILSKAERIVFIGYSLPASDGFMKALLTGAAAERAGAPPWEIYVVDPDPATHKRYKATFKQLICGWDVQTFSQAVAGPLGALLRE